MATTGSATRIDGLICVECREPFERSAKSTRVTCSRSCAVALSWKKNPEKRTASIGVARRTPESRAHSTEVNNRRWAKPENRAKLSEWNRRNWANPEWAKRHAQTMRNGWTLEKRAAYSETRRRQWAEDAAYRAAAVAGIRRDKGSPEKRALFSKLLRARWRDPVWRAIWTESMRRRMANPAERAKLSVAAKRRWAGLRKIGKRGWGDLVRKPIDFKTAWRLRKLAEQPLPETIKEGAVIVPWAMMRRFAELEGLGVFDGSQIDEINRRRRKRGEPPVKL